MLVLIATDELLAEPTPSDHHCAVDGELVTPVVLECPDELCDVCQRGWFGLVSHGATTTAMVVDRPGVTEATLRERLHNWLDCNGTIDLVVQAVEHGDYEVAGERFDDAVAAVDDLVAAHLQEVREICAAYPVGTLLSRMGQLVAPRAIAEAA
jgi:hypothetical protein